MNGGPVDGMSMAREWWIFADILCGSQSLVSSSSLDGCRSLDLTKNGTSDVQRDKKKTHQHRPNGWTKNLTGGPST